MEKFMLIFHGGQTHDLSPEQMEEHMAKWLQWVQQLTEQGRYLS